MAKKKLILDRSSSKILTHTPSRTLLLIDGNSLINRAFYGVRALTNEAGEYTNAVYGFMNILLKHLEDLKPHGVCVAFDVAEPTFRHKMFSAYKAKRKGMPDELRSQMPILKEVLAAMNIATVELPGYEADDIIGTISLVCDQQGAECRILTGDKDDLQLASENTKIMLIITKKRETDTICYDERTVFDRYRITAEQFIEVKALMGDPSDNIPGVAGVGEKTAFDLIERYKTLESVYAHLDELSPALQKKLVDSREIAYLSRELSTINRDVPLEIDLDAFRLRPYDRPALTKIFRRLGFSSLLKRLQLDESSAPKEYKKALISDLKSPQIHYFLDKDEQYLAVNNQVAKFNNPEELREIFEDEKIQKIGHNIKEDIVYLKKNGIQPRGFAFDTQIAAYVLAPERTSYNLSELLAEYTETGLPGDFPDSANAAAAHSEAVASLHPILAKKIEENGQNDLYYNIELPLIQVLADMQIKGFCVDKARLEEFSAMLESKIAEYTAEIYEIAGRPFNLNSPKQLGEILFDSLGLPIVKRTKTGYSTDAEVLEKLKNEHKIVQYILEYRKVAKLKSTYADGLLAVLNPDDGRIHSNFNQTVTVTGRISSTEPNLQNIPVRYELGREVRKMFVAPSPDYVLVDADYSQIELRVLAHIAGDEMMIKTFKNGLDIHTKTASEVFHVPLDEVTSEMRSRAKAVNFGIVYGIGDFSLAQDLHITRAEARHYIDGYLELYPEIKRYMHEIVEKGKTDGYVTTLFGRRRYLPELKVKNFMTRSFGERAAMNTPIQGTAADIIKIAMVRVHKRLTEGNFRSSLILQVHDELIVETYKPELDQVKAIVAREMANAAQLSVDLIADINTGQSWYESK